MGLLERNRRRLDIFHVKKEAKLSVRDIPGVEEGNSEGDLQCKSLFSLRFARGAWGRERMMR